jgi:hypothetical protein
LHFLRILEIYKIYGNLNQFKKVIKSTHSAGPASRPKASASWLGLMAKSAWPTHQVRCGARVVTVLPVPAAARSAAACRWARCSGAAAQAPGSRGRPAGQGGVARFSLRRSVDGEGAGEGRCGGARRWGGLRGGCRRPKGAPTVREDHGE